MTLTAFGVPPNLSRMQSELEFGPGCSADNAVRSLLSGATVAVRDDASYFTLGHRLDRVAQSYTLVRRRVGKRKWTVLAVRREILAQVMGIN